MIYIIGVDRYPDQCVVQRVDLETGKYLLPKTFKENQYADWAAQVINLIAKERPTQVIFDEYGLGRVFKDNVLHYLKKMINQDGTINYF